MMKEYVFESFEHFGKVTLILLIIWIFCIMMTFIKSLSFYMDAEIKEEAALAAAMSMQMYGRPYPSLPGGNPYGTERRKSSSASASKNAYMEAVQTTKIVGSLLFAIIAGVWFLILF